MKRILLVVLVAFLMLDFPLAASAATYQEGYEEGYFWGYDKGYNAGYDSDAYSDGYDSAKEKYEEQLEKQERRSNFYWGINLSVVFLGLYLLKVLRDERVECECKAISISEKQRMIADLQEDIVKKDRIISKLEDRIDTLEWKMKSNVP